jgi:hypothetical protein
MDLVGYTPPPIPRIRRASVRARVHKVRLARTAGVPGKQHR